MLTKSIHLYTICINLFRNYSNCYYWNFFILYYNILFNLLFIFNVKIVLRF